MRRSVDTWFGKGYFENKLGNENAHKCRVLERNRAGKQQLGMLEAASERAVKVRAKYNGVCCFHDQLFPMLREREARVMNCHTACGLCYPGIGEQGGTLLLLERYACST